jgi:N-methylhydantoinase A/oxoprolinase/acetone carboxylase beta subunit
MARIAVDIGGTFTDFVVEGDGAQFSFKLLTTQDAPERAVLDGIDQIIRHRNVAPDAVTAVIHGTTLATNAIIERRGACVGFVTTEGFRDVLEMGYEYRYDQYDLLIDRTPPLVERSLRFTVRERVAADGQVLIPMREADLAPIAAALRRAAVESVAIGFMHAYRNPDHESRAMAILAALLPGIPICTSSDVSPEIREYERFSTVVANAYVRPLMAGYLGALQDGLRARGLTAPLLLIQSNGGLCDAAAAMRYPVRLLESGPAGGAIFAAAIAAEMGLARTLLLDVGGTTAKLCFVDDGQPHRTGGMEVGRVDRFRAGSGLPLRFPVVELCEIGAGGGSLARVDPLGRLQVGPRSAGSLPGPACYGRGGSEATVTDANLVLGRLDPGRFADGTIRLDPAAAVAAVDRHVGAPLGLETVVAAAGILAIMHESMANAAREHAIDANTALAGRTLIGIGGGAALHAADLAAGLGIDTIIIPRDAGVGSAVGFLRAPIAFERALSWPERLAEMDAADTGAMDDRLCAQTVADVLATGSGTPDAVVTTITAQMRYRGQGADVTVPVEAGVLAAPDAIARLAAAFQAAYRTLYRRILSGPIEVMAWSARSALPVAPAPPLPRPAPDRGGAATTAALVDLRTGAAAPAAVVRRGGLAPDTPLPGPAVIVDAGTTVIVPAGWSATPIASGHLLLRAQARPASAAAA